MITEPWHLDADELGGANHQGAFGHRDFDIIDRQSDQILALFNCGLTFVVGDNRHRRTPLASPSASVGYRALLSGRSSEQTRFSVCERVRKTGATSAMRERTHRSVMLLLLRARGRRWCCARTERAPKPVYAWQLRTRRGSTGWQR